MFSDCPARTSEYGSQTSRTVKSEVPTVRGVPMAAQRSSLRSVMRPARRVWRGQSEVLWETSHGTNVVGGSRRHAVRNRTSSEWWHNAQRATRARPHGPPSGRATSPRPSSSNVTLACHTSNIEEQPVACSAWQARVKERSHGME